MPKNEIKEGKPMQVENIAKFETTNEPAFVIKSRQTRNMQIKVQKAD